MNCTHDSVECFFNTKGEEDFLFSYLNPEMEVLEWGSGSSTVAIAKRVKHIITIEHDEKYYHKLNSDIQVHNLTKVSGVISFGFSNIQLYHIKQNSKELSGHDGTYENYNDYINFPKALNKKFDLIFIDGRARVECAKIAVSLLKENGVILIHDYRNPNPACDRKEYHEVEQFLDIINFEYALYAFKAKVFDKISVDEIVKMLEDGKNEKWKQTPTNKNLESKPKMK